MCFYDKGDYSKDLRRIIPKEVYFCLTLTISIE